VVFHGVTVARFVGNCLRTLDDEAMGAIVFAAVAVTLAFTLASLVDLAIVPPRSDTWMRLAVALLVAGIASSLAALASEAAGIVLGVVATLIIGARGGRWQAALFAPCYYAGVALVFATAWHEGSNITLVFVLAIAVPIMIAFTGGLLAVAAVLRVLYR
jgi:hypothetical protein